MTTCPCGLNTQRVNFEIHVCVETTTTTKNINHPNALATVFSIKSPAPCWRLGCLTSSFLGSMQISEQSLLFAVSVAGRVAAVCRSEKPRGKMKSRKPLGLEWQVDKTTVTSLILLLYFSRILCTFQLSVWVNLGQVESALLRIRILTQRERKQY